MKKEQTIPVINSPPPGCINLTAEYTPPDSTEISSISIYIHEERLISDFLDVLKSRLPYNFKNCLLVHNSKIILPTTPINTFPNPSTLSLTFFLPSIPPLPTHFSISPEPSVISQLMSSQSPLPHLTLSNRYGSVHFPGPLEIAGVDVGKVVRIAKGEVEIYPQGVEKPHWGRGLNRFTQVEVYGVKGKVEDVERMVELMGAEFKGLEKEVLKFEIVKDL
jgi:hypothetical protein